MARPRKVTDEQVFEAATRVMQRLGPADWTLADIASEAGLTAGALVQRFGSKRRLQVALLARFAEEVPARYVALRRRHRSPLAALRAHATHIARLARTPDELAHQLDYLRLDLTDPDMHPHFRRQAEAGRAFITSTLEAARDVGELRADVHVPRLARLVETVIAGSLFTWATYREGDAAPWMRRVLEDLLGPFTAVRIKASRG